MKQPDLFEPITRAGSSIVPPPEWLPRPVARHSDPETSHEAACDATPRASAGRILALRTLAKWGALTDFELARETGWQQTSIGKRRGECVQMGLVEGATIMGVPMKRAAPSGSMALCWCITDAGRKFVAGL